MIHHEHSIFVKENGKWFYVKGIMNSKNIISEVQSMIELLHGLVLPKEYKRFSEGNKSGKCMDSTNLLENQGFV